MPQGGAERHLATVLFLDIVGSTSIASQIGDRRWRELLSRFRRIVHNQLHHHGGREENFTGDGFLATFQDPERAIRAGVHIAEAVHDLGIDVRVGVHTGECERIAGSLGGIAVHIASRVMGHAGTAEVLATKTVEELLIGANIEFERTGDHELKGVPGVWELSGVRSIDGERAPVPLGAEEAAERIAAVQAPPRLRRGHKILIGGAVAAAAVAVPIVLLSGATEPAPPPLGKVTLVKVDPATNRVVKVVRDEYASDRVPAALWSIGGALWQATPDELVRREIETGEPQITIPLTARTEALAFGFGSAWIAESSGSTGSDIRRHDAVTGRRQGLIQVPETDLVSLSIGTDALWAMGADGSLREIDPLRTRIVRTYRTGVVSPDVAVAVGASVWICDCGAGRVVRFDPRTGAVGETLETQPGAYLVPVDTEPTRTLWLLDPARHTLTRIDPTTGTLDEPVTLGGPLGSARLGFDALWVAGHDVQRIPLGPSGGNRATIEMPKGASAGSIAIDQQTGAVWIGNCRCLRKG